MLNLRNAFFLPDAEDAVELRAFTHGLMPRTVPTMMQHFLEDWKRYGVDAWNEVPNHWCPADTSLVGWWTLPDYLGDAFIAPLIGAPHGACILQPNVHWTMQCLLSDPALFTDRKEVVVTEAEFPSVLHSVCQWADLQNYIVRIVPLGTDGFVDQAAVLDAITDQTALVFLSHVGFTTGEKLPDTFLNEVAARVHRYGGLFALDGYHATASIPVKITAYDADVYFGGLLKEACGSSGNAYVYVRPGLDVRPRTTGWFGDANPFAFNTAPQPHPDVRRRFLSGTAAVASMYHAVEGVRVLLEAGLETVRAHSLELTNYCIERAQAASLTLKSPLAANRRGAMVILEVPKADRLCAYLKQHHIYTDSRKGRYLRLAPFVWNTQAELERTFDVIAEALQDGNYRTLSPATLETAGPVT